MSAHAPSTRVRFQRLTAVALLALFLAGALWWWNPAIEGPFPPCPLYWLTGLQCAGCGVLRATHQLLHGNVGAAFALNPLYVVAIPLAPVAAVLWWKGVRVWRPVVVAALIGISLAFTIARNVL